MNMLRRAGALLVKLRFPVILTLFIAMMILNTSNISAISSNITQQLFQSSRLEEATRAELEANDLFGKAYRFSRGDTSVVRKDVTLALDIFWSRISVLNTGSYLKEFTDAKVRDGAVIHDLSTALPQLEDAVAALKFGMAQSFDPVGIFAMRFQARITAFSDSAYVSRRRAMASMVTMGRENLVKLKSLQVENAIFAMVVFLYVIGELLLSRWLNGALRASMEEKKRLLDTDHLTGIANRRHFEAALQHRPAGREFSIVFVDLDGFKGVNDTLGHAAGDHLLKHVASTLQQLSGPGDVVSRLGGDEFAVLLEGSRDRASHFGRQAVERIAMPISFEGHPIHVTGSIGISHSRDLAPGAKPVALMGSADLALYAAKAAGRNCVRFLTREIQSLGNRRLRLEADLKAAIGAGEIELAFQPIVSLASGAPRAIEALVRWEHPELGVVPPLDIIAVAEKTNQILPLTLYVLDRACHVCESVGQGGRDLSISVNVSPRLLNLPEFGQAVAQVIGRHDIGRGRLLLELTEDAMMTDGATVQSNLAHFRALGIELAVDDFGKGYSNLSRLASLDFRKIKLDKSLIDNVVTSTRSHDIARSISRMAADMKIDVVAEGVETEEQKQVLETLGIPFAQGYYYARPMSALALIAHLDQRGHALDDVGPAFISEARAA